MDRRLRKMKGTTGRHRSVRHLMTPSDQIELDGVVPGDFGIGTHGDADPKDRVNSMFEGCNGPSIWKGKH